MDHSRVAILGVAVIWAAVILATEMVLKGSALFPKMLPILAGGAATTIIILGATRRRRQASKL